ncbi:hypothetical protein [Aquimarina sp. AU119]|uniref:hypothetical protein n=1 Tax=Aquimarina sp. AU119 TaxID=2108528 RepID=UPI000D69A3B9|nr:hypothetical protein [Aquimarina sp. AU119]
MKKKIDPNLLIAIGVLIASFSALFVYMRQASIMSRQTEILLEQTKANAWPRLSVNAHLNWSDKKLETLQVKIHNKGTGPAIIEGVRVLYDGKYVTHWQDLFLKTKIPDSISKSISNKSVNNSVMSANENFYWVQFINDPNLASWMYKNRQKITIEICYKSVFNDYWLLRKEGFDNDTIIQKLGTQECTIPSNEVFKT